MEMGGGRWQRQVVGQALVIIGSISLENFDNFPLEGQGWPFISSFLRGVWIPQSQKQPSGSIPPAVPMSGRTAIMNRSGRSMSRAHAIPIDFF